MRQVSKIARFNEFEGNASLQNAFELAMDNFQAIPEYGRREILIVFSSLTNCDPGDIHATVRKLTELNVQVNVVCLSAGIHLLQSVSQQTSG